MAAKKNKYSMPGSTSSGSAEMGRTKVRQESNLFNPKKPMTFREYEKRRDFLVDTAETKKQQKKLPQDLARLKANYEKAKAKKIKPAPMPKGPKSPIETGVRSKPRRGNIKPKKK
jgi:hypothetical protein